MTYSRSLARPMLARSAVPFIWRVSSGGWAPRWFRDLCPGWVDLWEAQPVPTAIRCSRARRPRAGTLTRWTDDEGAPGGRARPETTFLPGHRRPAARQPPVP